MPISSLESCELTQAPLYQVKTFPLQKSWVVVQYGRLPVQPSLAQQALCYGWACKKNKVMLCFLT